MDVDVKVKRKEGSKEYDDDGTYRTHQQNVIGLDNHINDEGNSENGTDGADGTLYEKGTGPDNYYSSTRIEGNEEKSSKNIDNNLKDSNIYSQFHSKDDNNDESNKESNDNTTINNDSYSYNASQASHASQTPISSTNMNSETTPKNFDITHVSQIDESTTNIIGNLLSCHYCDNKFESVQELLKHSLNMPPGKPAQPDKTITRLENERWYQF